MTLKILPSTALAAAVAVLASTSCDSGESDDLSEDEREEIAAAIKQRNQDLLDVWAQQDAFDDWMALYADEKHPAWKGDRYMLTVSGNSWGSLAEMEEAFREVLVDRTTQVTMTSESVAVLSDTHAVHFGDFRWSLTRDGETSVDYLATSTTAWVLEGDEWKILHYHQSWPSTEPVPAEG